MTHFYMAKISVRYKYKMSILFNLVYSSLVNYFGGVMIIENEQGYFYL